MADAENDPFPRLAVPDDASSLRELHDSEHRYRALFDSLDEGFCIIRFIDGPQGPLSDYVHVEANPAYELHAGIPDVVGQRVRDMVPDEAAEWVAIYGKVLETGEQVRFERELVATGRELELAAIRIEPRERNEVAVIFRDVTERNRAQRALRELNETLEARVDQALAERASAEEALRQSQKMEAVGQLTGGIAHDFNNLLAGISGAFEMIRSRIASGRSDDVERYLSAGLGAARRAAALTHRLLAFSRRQTLSPRAVNANRLLGEFVELVQRTVGPEIEVELVAASGLWPCLVDANQLENALLNLCINARDAMPDGGRITLETANRLIDDRTAVEQGLKPGQYISICVSDTGVGIDEPTLGRVFEPFFTTKPIGEGTGLGLSMVYGFARQSDGQVRIHSDVGEGTEVSLYLPRHIGEEDSGADASDAAPAVESLKGEVLVVDDEAIVRMLVVDTLEEAGFNCHEAGSGPEALSLLDQVARVDLLVTDVGLPGGLNGRQLAEAARVTRPALKVLFITGYAETAVMSNGRIDPGMEVLTKPFAVDELKARVRRILDGAGTG